MKTKVDCCYFSDGTVEEIGSWHQFGEDIVFFVKGQIYLFKYREFEAEIIEEEYAKMFGKFKLIKPRNCFYKYRTHEVVWPVTYYNKARHNRDEWEVADIKEIVLYTGEDE